MLVNYTGWTWEYIADHVDLPRLAALQRYWARIPPLHITVASYFGAIKQPAASADIAEAAAYVPVNRVSSAEFDALLQQHGLIQ